MTAAQAPDPAGVPLVERTVPRMLARSAALDPDRPFVVTRERTWSHTDAHRIVATLAAAFTDRGIGQGSRVAVMMPTSPRHVWLLLALAHLRAVPVALNPDASGEVLRYFVADSECVLGVVDQERAAAFATAAGPDGPPAIVLPPGADDLGELGSAGPGPLDPGAASFSDTFVVLYTSGSTGMPKATAVTHAQVITCGAVFTDRLGLGPADRLYTCLPLFHINATAYSLSGALVSGASLALGPHFSATTFWDDVADLGATEVNAMGSMVRILQSRPPRPAERAHRVRTMFVAPLPPDAVELSERFGLDFATCYAQTEWLPSSMTRPGEGYGRPGATGPVLPWTEVRIVGDDDRPLPAGQTGEIILRPRDPYTTFQGYLGKPQETVDAWRNLWFHTGDLGDIGPDGWLHYRGRRKDVIRRRGENIPATVVEDLLAGHPDIAEVAAVSVPAHISEEEIFAFVVPGAGAALTTADVEAHAHAVLPRYMVPSYLALVPDLPRTATNKIAKVELTERARAAVEGTGDPADAPTRTSAADRVVVPAAE
ncbi:AMP-binding protein [Pseudonocardia sp. N23]|uniref:AMP-binding protein n=1 Tax=Pseudonocardia sp. N23 TaxID=1987376 RepID=UPI000BFEA2E5|nr:AMP-binding protein [Pseudonocardia sp. N23]GAY07129.1 long-chain-fatty-acid--CoA ligase [Pseudonocardia sp. N23]